MRKWVYALQLVLLFWFHLSRYWAYSNSPCLFNYNISASNSFFPVACVTAIYRDFAMLQVTEGRKLAKFSKAGPLALPFSLSLSISLFQHFRFVSWKVKDKQHISLTSCPVTFPCVVCKQVPLNPSHLLFTQRFLRLWGKSDRQRVNRSSFF